MKLNDSVLPQLLAYVKVSSVLAQRQINEREATKTASDKAAAAIPQTVKAMVAANAIGENQQKAAADLLSTHAGTLELLQSAVEKIAELKGRLVKTASTELGEGADEPAETSSAEGYDSLNDNYIGRRTHLKKASDRALEKIRLAPAGR